MILGRKAQAGGYAQQRYRRGLRSWQLRNRRLFALLFGPFIVAGIVVGILTRDVVAWSAGMIAGGFVVLWIDFRDTPPHYVESWREGADGERKTEKALRPLGRADWRVFHDVDNGHGNYDHIALGPTGVYLLETKNLQGIVDIRGGVPHLSRRHDPDAHYSCEEIRPKALGAAARLKEEVEARCGHRAWVQAVVVFWSEFPEGLVEDGRCVFIDGSRLRAWMQERPVRLSQSEVDEIAAGIASMTDSVSADNVVPVPAGSSPA